MKDILHRARQVIATEIEGLLQILRKLDNQFTEAVHLLAKTSGKIVVMGVGKSGLIGRKISSSLSSTGTPSLFLDPMNAMHGDLGVIQNNDIVLAISYSGETRELCEIIPTIKKMGVVLIVMTGHIESRLGQEADILLNVSVPKEACPFGLVPTTSSTATLVLGDALVMSLVQEKNITPQQLSILHPQGTLGESFEELARDANAR